MAVARFEDHGRFIATSDSDVPRRMRQYVLIEKIDPVRPSPKHF